MTRARHITLLISAAVAVAVVVTLLTTLGPGDRPAAAPRATPAPTFPTGPVDIATLVLPFDAYETTPAEGQLIQRAEDRLLGACMRDRGMRWTPLPPLTRADTGGSHDRRYGLAIPGDAARYGYRMPPATPARERLEAVYAGRTTLPAEERRAAYGPDGATGGCWKKAHLRMERDVRTSRGELLARHSTQTFATARRHPDVLDANRRWSACMKREGHAYPDPDRPFDDPAWKKSPRPTARELSVARDDVRCKQSTGFLATWVRVDRQVQNAAIRSDPDTFRDLAHTRTDRLAAARKILRDTSS
ncbi:hypothetical protein ABT354_19005 [Streptomyces sp. NPDC000594]|uniref:hypothetical protein n=1 Tax=Streptomyces sp. NPDC000594 TaxID=3154261 RepID=UPI00332156CB